MKFLEAFEGGFTSPKGDLVEFRSSTSQSQSPEDEVRRNTGPASGARGNYYQCHYLYFGVRTSISSSSSGGRPGDQKNAVRLGVRERRELLSSAPECVLPMASSWVVCASKLMYWHDMVWHAQYRAIK